MLAEGTENDSIKFLPENSGASWKGITFYYGSGDDSKLKFCRISGSAEKGITIYTSVPQISNCTISGNSSPDLGGGFYVINSATNLIDCVIADNHAEGDGGGMFFGFNSHPSIQNCVIKENTSDGNGAGISFSNSSSDIADCEIYANDCSVDGGGIFCIEKSQMTITDCMIYDNSAFKGGGIYAADLVDLTIQSCGFFLNYAGSGGGAVYCKSASPMIREVDFHENYSDGSGGGLVYENCPQGSIANCDFIGNYGSSFGGLYILETPAEIINCVVSGNQTIYKGGGMGIEYSAAYVANCAIVDNSAGTYAGGIRIKGTDETDNPLIIDCTIRHNTSVTRGGGLDIWQGQPVISHCIIDGNSSLMGGALYIYWSANPLIENCTISGNVVGEEGSAIKNVNSQLRLFNSIVTGNQGLSGIYLNNLASADIAYNDFHANTGILFNGTVPSDLGQKVSVNLNSDSCDIFYNFFENPLFTAGSGDSIYLLTENSPCIDAGDPASPFDPDSTIADVGALWNGATLTAGRKDEPAISLDYLHFAVFPNPFNPVTTLNFYLSSKSRVSLIIYDVRGRLIAKLMDDWREAGVYSLEFDASYLPSGIYFARLITGESNRTQKLLLIK